MRVGDGIKYASLIGIHGGKSTYFRIHISRAEIYLYYSTEEGVCQEKADSGESADYLILNYINNIKQYFFIVQQFKEMLKSDYSANIIVFSAL